ncbi:MAG: hypothetical protein WCL50_12415, partial [Spirochaetota bacterium]
QEGGEMQIEFTGSPGDAMPVKDFLVPQLNAARERDVQATFILTFSPGLPLAGDAPEKLGERLAKFEDIISIERFGESGPAEEVARHLGLSAERVAALLKA